MAVRKMQIGETVRVLSGAHAGARGTILGDGHGVIGGGTSKARSKRQRWLLIKLDAGPKLELWAINCRRETEREATDVAAHKLRTTAPGTELPKLRGTGEMVDLTPTWEAWARIYARFAESNEGAACRELRADLMSMAKLATMKAAELKAAKTEG